MVDSPFGPELPDEEIAPAQTGAPSPDLGRRRVDAALAALASLGLFLPVGKVVGAASGPLKRAAIGGGLGAGMAAVAEGARAEEKFPSPMHELQSRLKKQGLYQGPVDGVSNPNGPTEKATERLKKMFGDGDPLHVLRMIQDPAYKASEDARTADTQKREADKAAAEFGKAETERKSNLDKEVKKAAAEGESWEGFAKRWAPYIGGGVLGGALGARVGMKHNAQAAQTAREAEKFATSKFAGRAAASAVGPKTVADKAGAVNAFWERGKGVPPFAHVTTSGELSPKSMSFRVPDQTPAGSLYKTTPADRMHAYGKDALALGAAGADYVGATALQDKNAVQAEAARKRFATSQSAQDAVEAAHAQGRSAGWGGLSNAALPFASAYLFGRYKIKPMKEVQPSMKATQSADAMRLKVQDYLNRQPAGGPQSVLAAKGGAGTPMSGQLALPAPAAAGGVGPHTSQMARAAKSERQANFDKIMSGSMATRTQQLLEEHVNTFGKAIKEGPNLGKPLLTTRKINELQRLLEAEHGMPVSNDRLRRLLKQAGVILS